VATERTELLTIRVTPDELRMLREVAEADGLTSSDVVRQFVRRTHAERFGAPTSPKRPKPKPKSKK
jgi:hypothetical protein